MNKIYFIICILFLLTIVSCRNQERTVDNKLRIEIFNECLKNTPKGPERTVANDWDEVIVECRNTSIILSEICVKNCNYIY
jgi:hypothetical protein